MTFIVVISITKNIFPLGIPTRPKAVRVVAVWVHGLGVSGCTLPSGPNAGNVLSSAKAIHNVQHEAVIMA